MKKLLSLLTVCALLACLCAFPAFADGGASLAGVYMLDATPLGMPLKVYLTIKEDGAFQWSNKLEGGADKGSGTIGEKDGVYLMLYSDSTNDNMKTATFTVQGKSLVFSTRVPYGSSGLAVNTEDPANPVYPTALLMAYEEYLGDYAGQYVSEGSMMGTVTYDLALTLGLGAQAHFASTFTVQDTTMTYAVDGTFSISDGALTITSADGATVISGTISEGGALVSLSAALSSMSPALKECTLSRATTSAYAGVYTAAKDFSQMGFKVSVALTLSKTGTYAYTASIGDGSDYTENGQFAVENGAITLKSADALASADPAVSAGVTGTLAADAASLKMRVSNSVPMSTEMTFYAEAVQGTFTASGKDDAGNQYDSTLTLSADGTYQIALNTNGAPSYTESGTFTTEESMAGVSIVLTDAAGTQSVGVVADTLNITHNIDGAFNTLGFKYAR